MGKLWTIKSWLFRNRKLDFFRLKTASTLVLVAFQLFSFGQNNLVPNGSFETLTSSPPNGYQDLYIAAPWFQPNFAATFPGGSTDLFTPSCLNSNYQTPNNFLNYQSPQSGLNYIGITTFNNTAADSNDYREYAEVGLTDTLLSGRYYCVKFYLSFANVMGASYASNKFGAYFSNDSLLDFSSTRNVINVIPQVVQSSVLTDTSTWIEVSGVFQAVGGERFLTIGNFSKYFNMAIDTIPAGSTGMIYPAYYFVDNISVYQLPDIFAGNDTLIPPGDSVQLGIPGRPDVFYNWSPTTGLNDPNIPNPVATPGSSVTYTLTVTDTNQLACNSVFYDTVAVQVGYIGVDEQSEISKRSNLYPNPSSGNCIYDILLMKDESGTLMVYDITGRLLLSYKLNSGRNKVAMDLSDFDNGVYLCKIIINGNIVDNKKLVIQK